MRKIYLFFVWKPHHKNMQTCLQQQEQKDEMEEDINRKEATKIRTDLHHILN